MIKLTMTFLDNTTDKKILSIYNEKYLNQGRELGEMSISHEGKIKTLLITERTEINTTAESPKDEEERGQELSINDFTTHLVSLCKIEEITAERVDETTDETTNET